MHPIALLAISVLMTTTGQLLLKEGMNRHGHLRVRSSLGTLLRVAFNPWIVGGFSLVFAASILWLSVISYLDLSLAYPLLSSSYIVVLLGSAIFLKERVTRAQVIGVVIITCGVALVSTS